MSNNKTVVPGMGNAFDYQGTSAQVNPVNPVNPVNGPQGGYSGTHFPGMNTNAAMPGVSGMPATEAHKPIMGFLFSVSRTMCGEYWPLYMGLNTIGRATSCSVRLSEATISDNHAEIVIRQMKNPDSVLVSIQDARSTCGTLLNGSSLGFDAQECHNGDIITIGEHYELYFVLIDAKSLGLEPRADFIASAGAGFGMGVPSGPGVPMPSMPGSPAPGLGGAPQFPKGTMSPGGQVEPSRGTVIMPAKK
ncbi:FHA domain-containing protein [Alistipes sp. D31t1_170403_E11]|jgi:hypothetical protein|uniref:FHA domain-containing protein n=1 Tax=Alistipes sp. D31t1_170403_E11 TaxID=2787128 RepID=UPI0018999D2B|nr:FHA domain-containing protein [Alistipes sp. D31t1_170403_E11]